MEVFIDYNWRDWRTEWTGDVWLNEPSRVVLIMLLYAKDTNTQAYDIFVQQL